MTISLSPMQQAARAELVRVAQPGIVAVLFGAGGKGKSTILRDVHQERRGQFLGIADYMTALDGRHPLELEEALHALLTAALTQHDVVFLDDLHLVANISCCGSFYPRQGFINAALAAVGAVAHDLVEAGGYEDAEGAGD
jgi:hypothetical protein